MHESSKRVKEIMQIYRNVCLCPKEDGGNVSLTFYVTTHEALFTKNHETERFKIIFPLFNF
jgi:hypothetical protein